MKCLEEKFLIMKCLEEMFLIIKCLEEKYLIMKCLEEKFLIMKCLEEKFLIIKCAIEEKFLIMGERIERADVWCVVFQTKGKCKADGVTFYKSHHIITALWRGLHHSDPPI
uniref:Uncharacterized protein n=1 Tax=Cacopsylla melanoneura TaxID=428564 RepID=A0A8D8Z8U6_9HEMI